jgi:hypothetical protein
MIPLDRLRIVWQCLQALSTKYQLDSSWMSMMMFQRNLHEQIILELVIKQRNQIHRLMYLIPSQQIFEIHPQIFYHHNHINIPIVRNQN